MTGSRAFIAAVFALALGGAAGGAAPAAADVIAFPVYGNWCGPWHSGGSPVDALDEACMRHDLCYGTLGVLNCSCDLALMDTLRRTSWPSGAVYDSARAIYEVVGIAPCFGSAEEQSTKFDWVRNDHLGAVARGRESPDAALERGLDLLGRGLENAYPTEP
ncbi:MAG: hypothetical protein KDK10_15900 [Maritimibacter sp.]|nr:hypothetical protein [Maritimibacter sp.]